MNQTCVALMDQMFKEMDEVVSKELEAKVISNRSVVLVPDSESDAESEDSALQKTRNPINDLILNKPESQDMNHNSTDNMCI